MIHVRNIVLVVAAVLIVSWSALPAHAASGLFGSPSVSFGAWLADRDEPTDRFMDDPPMGGGNVDQVIPKVVMIKRGGAVNFNIAGLHNLTVYDDGKKPEDVVQGVPLPGRAGGIIDDPNGRIFWGQDPNRDDVPRDRVEVVKFPKPGLYLVICAVVNHFNREDMWGYVKVL